LGTVSRDRKYVVRWDRLASAAGRPKGANKEEYQEGEDFTSYLGGGIPRKKRTLAVGATCERKARETALASQQRGWGGIQRKEREDHLEGCSSLGGGIVGGESKT